MMQYKKTFVSLALILFTYSLLISQSIGVRAGWNLNKFIGPLEPSEKYSNNNGIHFGINYGYKFTSKFTLRAELAYNQTGTTHSYDSTAYFLIYTPKKTVFEEGRKTMKIQVSNSYVSVPLTASYQISKKFEIFAGVSPNFLISPTGRGTMRFESYNHPKDIIFKQALDHKYYSDKAKAQASLFGSQGVIRIRVDGEIVSLPKSVGAYYQDDVVFEKKYNWFSASALAGINYYVNKGLYFGLRAERGFTDLTDNKMDYQQSKLQDNLLYIRKDDKDFQLTYQLSMGFRF